MKDLGAPSQGVGTRGRAKWDGWLLAVFALLIRMGVVLWAWGRFPPAADASYYQIVAERISQGAGYTWLWPDGAVTFAAHYPVGYPAMLGALYALFGANPAVAMSFNALLGAFSVLALHRIVLGAASRKQALAAALLLALHPGLVAYTPALMTEGVTASLLTCGAWAALRIGKRWSAAETPRKSFWQGISPLLLLPGAILGAATLVRPQSILLAPLLAWVSAGGFRNAKRALIPAALTCALALLVCAPWTARNCVRMKSCALVSVNGGWNLLIGADEASTGSWTPIKVPDACREVWDEAAKDTCFGREAKRYIVAHPISWLSLVPKKLGATFNYSGAAGWYLHASNPKAFPENAKIALGAFELAYERLLLIAALIALSRRRIAPYALRSPRALLPLGIAFIGLLSAFSVQAWIAYTLLAVLSLWPVFSEAEDPFLIRALGVVLLATLFTHALFFGAGRYSLVVFPFVCGVAALAFKNPKDPNFHPEKS